MASVKITCDSTCDLSQKFYTENQIEVIPMVISLGEDTFFDGVDVHPKDIFAYAEATGTLPKTGAPSIGTYSEVFHRLTESGYDVVHISLSSSLSSGYSNARIAAEEMENVWTVDSLNLSSGSGLLVIAAAELAEAGKSGREIFEALEELKTRLDSSFVLQTLEYLKMGGRCSPLKALGANMLKLRPEIVVSTQTGTMSVGTKYRGNIERSVTDYICGRLENRTDIDLGRIILCHSGVPEEILEKCRKLILQLQPFEELIDATAGCTISSHCGPACLGVLFIKKP